MKRYCCELCGEEINDYEHKCFDGLCKGCLEGQLAEEERKNFVEI